MPCADHADGLLKEFQSRKACLTYFSWDAADRASPAACKKEQCIPQTSISCPRRHHSQRCYVDMQANIPDIASQVNHCAEGASQGSLNRNESTSVRPECFGSQMSPAAMGTAVQATVECTLTVCGGCASVVTFLYLVCITQQPYFCIPASPPAALASCMYA